ncbi:MAG: S1C family serine protease [Gemmataceae bacterium]
MKRLLTMLFVGGCAMVGGALSVVVVPRLTSPVSAQVANAPMDLGRLSQSFEDVSRRLLPSVVYVEANKPVPASEGRRAKTVEESGSGVIVRDETGKHGYLVLTNNHVVADAKPDQITIHVHDGRLFHPVKMWTDPESDVAVLALDNRVQVQAARLGDSNRVRVGQWVLAFGSPFGLNQTVTHGIISARERGQISLGSTIRIKDFLQTDAAINPGSSGGPLVNLDGEVIGINTAIASNNGSNSGVAFSIPMNLVQRVTRQLIEKGSVSRGYLGVQLASSFEPGDALRLGLDRVQGALVERVYPETPAAGAGLRPNDIILQINGTAIRNENHLINMVSALPAGQGLRLVVWRERRQIQLDTVVGDWEQARLRSRQ